MIGRPEYGAASTSSGSSLPCMRYAEKRTTPASDGVQPMEGGRGAPLVAPRAVDVPPLRERRGPLHVQLAEGAQRRRVLVLPWGVLILQRVGEM